MLYSSHSLAEIDIPIDDPLFKQKKAISITSGKAVDICFQQSPKYWREIAKIKNAERVDYAAYVMGLAMPCAITWVEAGLLDDMAFDAFGLNKKMSETEKELADFLVEYSLTAMKNKIKGTNNE